MKNFQEWFARKNEVFGQDSDDDNDNWHRPGDRGVWRKHPSNWPDAQPAASPQQPAATPLGRPEDVAKGIAALSPDQRRSYLQRLKQALGE